ncbi:MAG TPA: hydrogenase maturation nickel metallochaperone HypA [Blastocatellia bacterium]|nr:hydrogenase maturation nickel metallochaperone HypA [Blastocatellia bacterium]
MHEMALAEGILAVVLDAAEGQKVRRVCLRVGRLQMVVPDSLQFSFQLISEGTPAAEAAVEMQEVPVRLLCKGCGKETEADRPPFNCSLCGAFDVEVASGDEMIVDAVELENGVTIRRREVPADEILEEHLRDHAAHGSGHSH